MSALDHSLPPHLQKLADTLPPYLSVRKSAEIHGCHFTTIYDYINAGKIEAVKMGKRTLIATHTVLAHLASLPPMTGAATLEAKRNALEHDRAQARRRATKTAADTAA